MKYIFVIILWLVFWATGGYAQKEYEYVDLDTLNPAHVDLTPDEDLIHDYSGIPTWFPYDEGHFFSVGLDYNVSIYNGSHADNIRSSLFRSTPLPFSSNIDIDSDDLFVFDDAFSDKVSSGAYRGFSKIGFTARTKFYKYFPVVRTSIGFAFSDGLLIYEDNSKAYLNKDGVKKRFKEIGLVQLEETFLNSSIGVDIPIWGFLSPSMNAPSSYYYLHAGVSVLYALSSEFIQSRQIANNDNIIRYNNGKDLYKLQELDDPYLVNRFRYYFDLELGNTIGALPVANFCFSVGYSYHLNSVLKDAIWKQHKVYCRLSLEFNWKFLDAKVF